MKIATDAIFPNVVDKDTTTPTLGVRHGAIRSYGTRERRAAAIKQALPGDRHDANDLETAIAEHLHGATAATPSWPSGVDQEKIGNDAASIAAPALAISGENDRVDPPAVLKRELLAPPAGFAASGFCRRSRVVAGSGKGDVGAARRAILRGDSTSLSDLTPAQSISMFDTEIIRIPIELQGSVNAHLVRSVVACILVDVGPPGSELQIAHSLARHGLSFRDIKLIVLTHGHADCAGNAARLRDLSGAPILAHEDDADLYGQTWTAANCSPGRAPAVFRGMSPSDHHYRGFEPDITMKRGEQINLLNFAVDGIVRHVGGHTPGSIIVELASRDVLAGGLESSHSRAGRGIDGPGFASDLPRIARELARLVKGGAKRLHFAHGTPMDSAAIGRCLRALAQRGITNP